MSAYQIVKTTLQAVIPMLPPLTLYVFTSQGAPIEGVAAMAGLLVGILVGAAWALMHCWPHMDWRR